MRELVLKVFCDIHDEEVEEHQAINLTMQTDNPKASYEIDVCKSCFDKSSILQNARVVKAPKAAAKEAAVDCPVCGKTCASMMGLRMHSTRQHGGERGE